LDADAVITFFKSKFLTVYLAHKPRVNLVYQQRAGACMKIIILSKHSALSMICGKSVLANLDDFKDGSFARWLLKTYFAFFSKQKFEVYRIARKLQFFLDK